MLRFIVLYLKNGVKPAQNRSCDTFYPAKFTAQYAAFPALRVDLFAPLHFSFRNFSFSFLSGHISATFSLYSMSQIVDEPLHYLPPHY